MSHMQQHSDLYVVSNYVPAFGKCLSIAVRNGGGISGSPVRTHRGSHQLVRLQTLQHPHQCQQRWHLYPLGPQQVSVCVLYLLCLFVCDEKSKVEVQYAAFSWPLSCSVSLQALLRTKPHRPQKPGDRGVCQRDNR